MRRYQGYDTLDEELFEAQLAMKKWFTAYINNLEQQPYEKPTPNLPQAEP